MIDRFPGALFINDNYDMKKNFGNSALRVMCLLLTALSVMQVQSKPPRPGVVSVSQPDGTKINVVMRGGWQRHMLYAEDGCPLKKNEAGFYVQAESGDMVSAKNDLFLIGSESERKGDIHVGRFDRTFPVTGEQKGLVVLVNFTDVAFSKESDPHDYFTKLLNEEGFSDHGSTGSARDYFIDNSCGMFVPTFDVYGPVTLSREVKYYGGNSPFGGERHAYEMAVEACSLLDDDVDFSEYDCDGDGVIDNVYIYYAGYGEADSFIEDTVWPHSWHISYQSGAEHIYDGVRLDRYACSNEIDHANDRTDGIGTFVHEFSHVLGLPDLYQTDGAYDCFTPGAWSVMDVGSYNNEGRTPPNFSTFERNALGWIELQPLADEDDCRFESLGSSNAGFVVAADNRNEFFFFENRQQAGWDEYLPGHGMLVWHVDYSPQVWADNGVNNDADHQRVDVVEADGKATKRTMAGDTFPGTGDVYEFSEDSYPSFRFWNNDSPGFDIKDIWESEDGTVSFKVRKNISGIKAPIDVPYPELQIEGNFVRCVDSVAEVWDLNGRKLETVGHDYVWLPSGLYVVKIEDRTFKIKI